MAAKKTKWVLVLTSNAGTTEFYADPNKKNVLEFAKKAVLPWEKAKVVKKAA